jgi:hypothetical protein
MFTRRFWLILAILAVTLVTAYATTAMVQATAGIGSAIARPPAVNSIDDYRERGITVRS